MKQGPLGNYPRCCFKPAGNRGLHYLTGTDNYLLRQPLAKSRVQTADP